MASILVVCTGNICRSPIAEGFLRRDLLRRFGPDAPTVSSAGMHAWEGNEVSDGSVLAAAERGTDIAGHRARQVTPHLVRGADLVLCMASDHRRAIADLVPEAWERTFTLKELVRLLEARPSNGSVATLAERVRVAAEARAQGVAGNPYDEDISDPLGQPLQAYRGVAWGCSGPERRRAERVRIAMGADHAGFQLKEVLKRYLEEAGHQVVDVGTDSEAPVDYPGFCAAAARAVVAGEADRAVVLGGSGQGEQIAANKVRGIRAALCNDTHLARLSRLHNDANVLAMGGRIVAPALAEEILELWLATPFEGGRHAPRLEQIAEIERGEP